MRDLPSSLNSSLHLKVYLILRADDFNLHMFKNHLKERVMKQMVSLKNEIESIEEDFETKLKDVHDSITKYLN